MPLELSIINGPNINMLGKREKSIYGDFTLLELNEYLIKNHEADTVLHFYQSNSESELIHYIQSSGDNKNIKGIVINAGAFTHTSIAIRDALLSVSIPFIEVHISNVFSREGFRHTSYLSDKAIGVITGFGKNSYDFAIEHFKRIPQK